MLIVEQGFGGYDTFSITLRPALQSAGCRLLKFVDAHS